MKLVVQSPTGTMVRMLRECDLEPTIAEIKGQGMGRIVEPLANEIFRYRTENGVAVIYGDNRVLRAKNFWFEIRALHALAIATGEQFFHGKKLQFDNGLETEVDGIDVSTGRTMVEVKRTTITQEWIDFYEQKRQRLAMRECWVVASTFEKPLIIPTSLRCFTFVPDDATLMTYYNEHFHLPDWIESLVPPRHVRILLVNGRWHGIKRKLTRTAKHTPTSKLVLALNNLYHIQKLPVRIYYSLAPMVRPVAEYQGRGYPFTRTLAAFDVDSGHTDHVIGREGYCTQCLLDAETKAAAVASQLTQLGHKFLRVYSGAKGFHFYLLNEGSEQEQLVKEISLEAMEQLSCQLANKEGVPLTDNPNFRAKAGFDIHRIFKLPATVDASTGIVVQETLKQLQFHDVLADWR